MASTVTPDGGPEATASRLQLIGLLLAALGAALLASAVVQALDSSGAGIGVDLDAKLVVRVLSGEGGSYLNAALVAGALVAVSVGTSIGRRTRAGAIGLWVVVVVGLVVSVLAVVNAGDTLLSSTGSDAVGSFTVGSPSVVARLSTALPMVLAAAVALASAWAAFGARPRSDAVGDAEEA